MAEDAAGATGAGALLRAAREKQGLHIAALAASIKITPRKLEALEADRYDELPDATFTRALALAVCRALKIDPAPVLSRLPQPAEQGLSRVAGGLNEPFRERSGRVEPNEFAPWRHPLVWAAGLLALLALLVGLVPTAWWSGWAPAWGPRPASSAGLSPASDTAAPASGAAASAADVAAVAASAALSASATQAVAAAVAASVPVVEVVHAAPPAEAGASAVPPAGVAVLRVTEPSWIEVVDAAGQVLVQRTLQPGESVGLDGRLPMRVKVGNAAGTQISLRGQPVDLTAATRDNIARLELK